MLHQDSLSESDQLDQDCRAHSLLNAFVLIMLLVSVATNKGSSHSGISILHAQKALLIQGFCPFHSTSPAAFLQFKWLVFFRSRPKTQFCICIFSVQFYFWIQAFYEIQIQFLFYITNVEIYLWLKKKKDCCKKLAIQSWEIFLLLLARQVNEGFY